MKKRDIFLLLLLFAISAVFVIFSADAKQGAREGFLLAENTILPSLLPLLMIFYMIMKSSANIALVKMFGQVSTHIFRLPKAAISAIIFGLIGGYPTGAVLTKLLYESGEISDENAKRLMRFNFCGGAGFIITAVGTITLSSHKAGIILFCSNVLAAIIIGVLSALFYKKVEYNYDTVSEPLPFGEALSKSATESMTSIISITAYIVLFSAIDGVVGVPKALEPFFEITNGICSGGSFSLPIVAGFLSFGGFCIHFQLLGIIKEFNMKYLDFLFWRCVSALLCGVICYLLLLVFPTATNVFSNTATTIAKPGIVNTALSFLLVFGSFVMVFDLNSKKRKI